MNREKKLGVGIVGPGFIAPHHLDALRRLDNVSVVASGIARCYTRCTPPFDTAEVLINNLFRQPLDLVLYSGYCPSGLYASWILSPVRRLLFAFC
jgi:hypothetical protein